MYDNAHKPRFKWRLVTSLIIYSFSSTVRFVMRTVMPVIPVMRTVENFRYFKVSYYLNIINMKFNKQIHVAENIN